MSLFKALVLVLQTSAANPPAIEIGPFTSHSQCMEAGKAILAPNSRDVKTEGSTISGLTTIAYSGAFERKDYGLGVRVTCYEVAP